MPPNPNGSLAAWEDVIRTTFSLANPLSNKTISSPSNQFEYSIPSVGLPRFGARFATKPGEPSRPSAARLAAEKASGPSYLARFDALVKEGDRLRATKAEL